ncbi:MAG: SpoIIE family protein phosphatase [Candidatus Sumerlaeota bacterium]
MKEIFLEVAHAQERKHGQATCGDVFISRRDEASGRIIACLADGMGSGVKANILATMTATMALKFVESHMDIVHAAEIIRDSLPVCSVRKIGYSTFTIVDHMPGEPTRVIEMGNPPLMVFAGDELRNPQYEEIEDPKTPDGGMRIYRIQTRPQDRLVVISDGVSQAGLGTEAYPLGWRVESCRDFALECIEEDRNISASALSRRIVRKANSKDLHHHPGDDTTCGVFYYREPRKLLVCTGPPYDRKRDRDIARMVRDYDGRVAICGGTTAEIVARELERPLKMDLSQRNAGLPPMSKMEGVNLVAEGILTLTRVQQLMERGGGGYDESGPSLMTNLLLDSDEIEFIVGTRINEAHQDPSLPEDIEIRRNIIKNITRILKERHLKKATVRYV